MRLRPASTRPKIESNLERGVLTITGERKPEAARAATRRPRCIIDERFAGRFRRVLSLPDDIDPNAVTASYRDGVLHIQHQAPRGRAAAPHPGPVKDGGMNHDQRRHPSRPTQPGPQRAREAALLPPVDVIEDAQGITLYADLPGVPRDKLHAARRGRHADDRG